MSKRWSTVRALAQRSRRGSAAPTQLRGLRVVVAVATALAAATASVIVAAAPAHADQPGLFCTITSRGTISAPPSIQRGQLVTVQWTTQTPYCASPVVFIVGPGFTAGASVGLGGTRQFRIATNNSSATWLLYIYDMEVDSPSEALLASWTANVV